MRLPVASHGNAGRVCWLIGLMPGRCVTASRLTERSVFQYAFAVIRSFADKRTAAIFAGYAVRGLPRQIQQRARAKLIAIDAAKALDDLRLPPGNRLEALRGDRHGQFSIRVNEQWRVCFAWRENTAWDVKIVDYH